MGKRFLGGTHFDLGVRLHFLRQHKATFLIGVLLFAFYSFGLVIPKGIGVPGVLLVLLGIALCFRDTIKGQSGAALNAKALPIKAYFVPMLLLSSFGIAATCSLLATDPAYLSWSRFDHPSRYLLVLFLFWAISKRKINPNMLYWAFCLGSIGCGLIAFYSFYITGQLGATGAAGHRIMFGCLAAMLTIFVLNMQQTRPDLFGRVFGICAFLSGSMATLLSGSRGAWLGFLVTFLVWLVLTFSKINKKFLVVLTGVLVGGLLADTYLGRGLVQDRVMQVERDISAYMDTGLVIDSSVGSRLEMWKAAIFIFSEHPFLGAGPKTFYPESKRLIENGGIRDYQYGFQHAHSQYLEALATMGLIGFCSLLILWLGPLLWSVKFKLQLQKMVLKESVSQEAEVYANLCILLCVGFIVFGLTEAILDRHIGVLFFLITACVCLSQMVRIKYRDL